jgi:D-alanyl-lipoteichoic acid acyltransferase DltB (MBOAT superfamily)
MADSSRIVIESPFSFAGSKKRIWNISSNPFVRWLLLVWLVMFAWMGVVVWYMVWGLWVAPWRLLRRGHRREKRDKLRHQEMMAQVERVQQGAQEITQQR